MPRGILGQSALPHDEVNQALRTFAAGYERAIEAHPQEVKALGRELKAALGDDDGDVEPVLSKLLNLDPEWKELGVRAGIVKPDGPQPMAVCGGLCIFVAGVAVGAIAASR